MKTVTCLKRTRGQQGAVAIMFGLTLLVLFGFMALVFDLGRTYVVRTELQNAADAAALAGAKDLNQKLVGVTQAIATVKAIGLQNNTKFSFNGDAGIEITDAMISVSSCPDGCTWTQASTIASDDQAADKTFLKVDTSVSSSLGRLDTFFARIAGKASTSTYGRAVAGYYLREITPIGICAIDLKKGGTRDLTPSDPNIKELTEYGFRRGVAYNIMELGPLGGSGQPYLLNPVDTWPGPECDPSHSSATYTAPFVCTGTSAAINTVPGNVFGNTGISAGPMEVALNSRFNVNACAPQDANVKTYAFDDPSVAGSPKSWMEPDPSRQTIRIERDPVTGLPYVPSPLTSQEYGVLWSYSRAVRAVGSSPDATAGTPFELDKWSALYPVSAPPNLTADDTSGYLSNTVRPYDTSVEPTGGEPDRRVLNIAIVNCSAATGTGCNSTIPIVGIGRFFMQVKADLPKTIEAEFGGLVNPIPSFEIRLYR